MPWLVPASLTSGTPGHMFLGECFNLSFLPQGERVGKAFRGQHLSEAEMVREGKGDQTTRPSGSSAVWSPPTFHHSVQPSPRLPCIQRAGAVGVSQVVCARCAWAQICGRFLPGLRLTFTRQRFHTLSRHHPEASASCPPPFLSSPPRLPLQE